MPPNSWLISSGFSGDRIWRPRSFSTSLPIEANFDLFVRYRRTLGGCYFAMLSKKVQMCEKTGEVFKAILGTEIGVYVTIPKQTVIVYDGTIVKAKDMPIEPKEAKPTKPDCRNGGHALVSLREDWSSIARRTETIYEMMVQISNFN